MREPVIGVIFDGAGYGTDGAIWSGEFLVGAYGQFRRAGHLRYVGMPGGEPAVREPWPMALAHLVDAEWPDDLLESQIPTPVLRAAHKMLDRGFNTPMTSSAGRLFDAVAETGTGWRLADAPDLPDAEEVWRLLLAEAPDLVAELALIAAANTSLPIPPLP